MIVAERIGQIDVAARQRDADLGRAELFDVRDGADEILPARFGLASMQVDRIDDVIGIEFLAGVEFDALADVEHPFRGARPRLPAFQQLALSIALLVDVDEGVEDLVGDTDRDGIRIGPRVEAVRRASARHAEAQRAAFFGRPFGAGGTAHRAKAEAKRAGTGDQFAAVKDQAGRCG